MLDGLAKVSLLLNRSIGQLEDLGYRVRISKCTDQEKQSETLY